MFTRDIRCVRNDNVDVAGLSSAKRVTRVIHFITIMLIKFCVASQRYLVSAHNYVTEFDCGSMILLMFIWDRVGMSISERRTALCCV